jgi:hypothetical protein
MSVRFVLDKLVVEDKYEPKPEPDKLNNSTTKAIRASKRLKKPPITKKNDFYGKKMYSTDKSPLLIFNNNICGLRKKKQMS